MFEDIGRLNIVLLLTKTYPFVYLLFFINKYCSLKAETLMHML